MSSYKRKRRRQGPGQSRPARPAARESVQVLAMEDFDLRKEMDYIVQAASRADARIVTVGPLVFFSTSDGDAWVLDAEDKLALRLMRGLERCEVEIQESAENFSIRWDSTFAIEKGCFWVTGHPERMKTLSQMEAAVQAKAMAYPSYPVADLERAIQRARRAARPL